MPKEKILVVEDDGIVALDIKSRLKKFGYSVFDPVSSGELAIERAEQLRPDLVMMDIILNGEMDGIEAAEIISSRFDIPVIFLSAYVDHNKIERVKRSLPYGYILKPFRDVDIRNAVEIAIYASKVNAERKQTESALRKAHDEMERRVEERTRDLKKVLAELEHTNLRLQDINRHKNQFLSTMSHELRTPLNGIIGSADLLREQLFGPLNPKQLSYTKQINDSADHLLALINDLLDIAKIDAGAITVDLEYLALTDWIDTTLAIMKAQFRKKRLTLEIIKDPSITHIDADRRKCKQIMLHLLSNAIKFTPQDGQVKVRTSKKNDRFLLIEVSDTGCGVKEDERDKIFSEFYQTEQVRTDPIGGTGIGLALTRRMVEMHEGEIGVKNQPVGPGSVFWFTLPLKLAHVAEANEEETSANGKADGAKLTGRRILVVEDNEINLSMVLDMLSIHEHKVSVAKNGQQAIDLAQTFKPELILMDVKMPMMNGLEATRILRAMPVFAKIPIIALTASVEKEDQSAQTKAGCTAHLSKPIKTKELFDIIECYLG
ncbi:response regulator [Desulfococcaceae bacterium HSG7]|nr:response regulator [Desulfococcaceae bacterium HSG7]